VIALWLIQRCELAHTVSNSDRKPATARLRHVTVSLTARLQRLVPMWQNNRTASAGARWALCEVAFHCTGN
jgi:hypothetical protein